MQLASSGPASSAAANKVINRGPPTRFCSEGGSNVIFAVVRVLQCVGNMVTWVTISRKLCKRKKNVSKSKKMNLKKKKL
jgi:hypothetical protein